MEYLVESQLIKIKYDIILYNVSHTRKVFTIFSQTKDKKLKIHLLL